MVSAKPPSLRLGSLDTLICPLMPRSATVVFHWFDAPRPLRRASAPHPRSGRGIRHPVGRIATAGRRPCSGSEPEAQRTPGRLCPAVAIVIFGRISSVAALRQVLLRDQEPKRGSARRWNVKTQIGAIATRSSGPFLAREGRRKRQTGAPPDPGTRPRPIEATRSPAEAGPKSGRKRPKRGK